MSTIITGNVEEHKTEANGKVYRSVSFNVVIGDGKKVREYHIFTGTFTNIQTGVVLTMGRRGIGKAFHDVDAADDIRKHYKRDGKTLLEIVRSVRKENGLAS